MRDLRVSATRITPGRQTIRVGTPIPRAGPRRRRTSWQILRLRAG